MRTNGPRSVGWDAGGELGGQLAALELGGAAVEDVVRDVALFEQGAHGVERGEQGAREDDLFALAQDVADEG